MLDYLKLSHRSQMLSAFFLILVCLYFILYSLIAMSSSILMLFFYNVYSLVNPIHCISFFNLRHCNFILETHFGPFYILHISNQLFEHIEDSYNDCLNILSADSNIVSDLGWFQLTNFSPHYELYFPAPLNAW